MAMVDDIPSDFISQFHNLEGDLIGQRKKNFFKLILNPSSFPDEKQLDHVLEHLQPTTYLENSLKIDMLIHFKRTAQLVEVLKQGNEVFISKILKQLWFFNEAFKDMEAKKLVNELLPCLPYAIRMKLVKKISKCWTENQMDALFDSLEERYGIFIAKTILSRCSSIKIEQVLKENEIRLPPAQVKYIFDKDVNLFKFYLDYINSLDKTCYDESKVLNHVALKNPTLLLELEKSEKVQFSNLGRRTSKRIMDLVKDDVSKDINRYLKLLNNSIIVRKLAGDFGKVYQQLFPKKIDTVNRYSTYNKLLMLSPKSGRWSLFCETYSKVFPGSSVEGIYTSIDDSLLKLNPGREVIKKWAVVNYDLQKNNDFLKYYEPSEAIPILKEKIKVTSDIWNRTSLVLLLLDCCAINNNLTALEEVLKYICFRHRNEAAHFRQRVISQITSNFKLDDLNENHWKCINEQLKIDRIKKEFVFWMNSTVLRKHLEFLFINGKDPKDAVLEYINDVTEANDNFGLNLDNPPIERQIFLEISKLISEALTGEKFDKMVKTLIVNVTEFSVKHPEHCIKISECGTLLSAIEASFSKNENMDIDVFKNVLLYNLTFPQHPFPVDKSRFFEVFVQVIKEGGIHCLKSVFQQRLLKKTRSEFENELVTFYLDKLLDQYLASYIIRWLLINEPRRLIPYFDEIIRVNVSALDSRQVRLYSHFGFDKKTSAFYRKQLVEEDRDENKIVKNLVELLSTDEFVSLANEFLPKKIKVDLEDAEMQRDYKLQCELAKVLHRVHEPSKSLPVVVKFCVGDYLQSALPALYSLFYRSPEKLLYPYVEKLAEGAVSVRKHAMFLSCEVLDSQRVLAVLQNARQTNSADQKHVFSATLKYFVKNPSRELFDAVVAGLKTIDPNDNEAMDSLTAKVKVPKRYMAMYVEKCWEWFETVTGVPITQMHLRTLLAHVSVPVLECLSPEFVRKIVKDYFGRGRLDRPAVAKFVVRVLRYRVSEREANFAAVYEHLAEFESSAVSTFFECFLAVCEEEGRDREFIDAFALHWNEHFPELEMFRERVALRLFLVELDRRSGEDHARRVVELLEELLDKYGPHVFDVFRDQLGGALGRLKEVERYRLFLDVLRHKLDPSTCVLVIGLMERLEPDDERKDVLELYEEAMKILKAVNEPIVKIYLQTY